MITRILFAIQTAVVLVCGFGCGSANTVEKNDLIQIGIAYHLYHEEHKQGPKNWEDLIAFMKGHNENIANEVERVKAAGYQAQWNLDLLRLERGMAGTVLAESPGRTMKLYCDGSVR